MVSLRRLIALELDLVEENEPVRCILLLHADDFFYLVLIICFCFSILHGNEWLIFDYGQTILVLGHESQFTG